MIDLQPAMSAQHDVEADRGFAQWQMVEHIIVFCEMEKRNRAHMHAALNEAVAPFGFVVLDCGTFSRRARGIDDEPF